MSHILYFISRIYNFIHRLFCLVCNILQLFISILFIFVIISLKLGKITVILLLKHQLHDCLVRCSNAGRCDVEHNAVTLLYISLIFSFVFMLHV